MKISKRQLRRIIREEKQKLLKENRSADGVIEAVEKGLAALMLQKVLDAPDGEYESAEIYDYMYDIGFEHSDTEAALNQLANKYNMGHLI